MLDNTPNQPAQFGTKNWIKINNGARGAYNTNSQIEFKTSMLKSRLCVYSDTYIPVSGATKIPNKVTAAAPNNRNNVIKNCAPFNDCISEINNTRIDNPKDIDVIRPMFNLIEYRDNYSKSTGTFWQCYRD